MAGYDILKEHSSHYENPLLKFTMDPKDTKLFAPLGDDAYEFETYNMTLNSHSWGLSPSDFA